MAAPKAISARASVRGSGTVAATSPERTATAYNATSLVMLRWNPLYASKRYASCGSGPYSVPDQ